MLLFNVALEEKGGKKEFNNVQLWRLREGGRGGGWGVLGLRPRIKFMDVWSPAQRRPELQPPAHAQEELTLLALCGKSPPPSLPPALPPAHPDVIKEFSSCLFALGCSCSPCLTPDSVCVCVYVYAPARVPAPARPHWRLPRRGWRFLSGGDCYCGSLCRGFVCWLKLNTAASCPAICGL